MLGKLDLKKVGSRLARVDRHFVQVLATRIGAGSLSDAVAECKRKIAGPLPDLTRKEIEDQRIAQVATWAEQSGLDPDYMAGLMYSIISESCRTQMNFLHKHFDDNDNEFGDDPAATWRFYREELLRLTKAVAEKYDDGYSREFFSTKIYLRFEKMEMGRIIADIDNHDLAIDLGCATGIKSLMLAESFKKVIGYDVSEDMITVANSKLEKVDGNTDRISFVLADLEEGIPQSDNSVSLVIMNLGTGSDIRNIDHLLAETYRVLRPGGAFIFSFYNSDSLISKLGFLPWPNSLAASVDPDKQCLEVHFEKQGFFIYAKPYTVAEINQKFENNGFLIKDTFTHPTLSSVIPEDILSTELFDGYGELIDGRRYCRAIMKSTANDSAKEALRKLDEELARSSQNLGAYILVTGVKELK